MDIIDAFMRGDIDAIEREQKEMEFKRKAEFLGHFRDTLCQEMRPSLVEWFKTGGQHVPKCGYLVKKGDLLRWTDATIHGKTVRMPTIRDDMITLAVEGKIEVKGVELLLWVATRLNSNTRNVFIALERDRRKKK